MPSTSRAPPVSPVSLPKAASARRNSSAASSSACAGEPRAIIPLLLPPPSSHPLSCAARRKWPAASRSNSWWRSRVSSGTPTGRWPAARPDCPLSPAPPDSVRLMPCSSADTSCGSPSPVMQESGGSSATLADGRPPSSCSAASSRWPALTSCSRWVGGNRSALLSTIRTLGAGAGAGAGAGVCLSGFRAPASSTNTVENQLAAAAPASSCCCCCCCCCCCWLTSSAP